MTLSRRQFLRAAGIAVAAVHMPRLPLNASATPGFATLYGRALQAAPLYATAQTNRLPLKHLWSDTVTPILETVSNWYRLPEGYTPRTLLQPMLKAAERSETAASAPFWGEVSGAIAVVRAWCAADAPLVTRIGHGGVMHISDRIILDGINWYGIAEDERDDVIGWAQAANWSPVTADTALPSLTLAVDTHTQQLNAYDGEQSILSAPVSVRQNLPTGHYSLTHQQMTTRTGEHYGAPWSLSFGDSIQLAGAYWHNHFGIIGRDAAPQFAPLEVTPALAQWLYPRANEVIIY